MSKVKQSKPGRLTRDEAVRQVFSNDMLVELILERAIRSTQGWGSTGTRECDILSMRDVLNFRLVNKLWKKTVIKLHRKAKQPLFHLSLTNENTSGLLAIEDDSCPEEETLLSEFLTSMEYWKSTEEPDLNIPMFHLELCPSFFRVANQNVYSSVFEFLTKYGTRSMTHFTFNFHRNRFDYIPTPDTFSQFLFPNLKHIKLTIERMAWSFIPLIQKLIEAAPNLETLDFTSSSCIVTYSVAHLTEVIESIARSRPYSIRLPNNTKNIFLYGTVDSCSCFYKLPVDNLKKLETISVSASACMIKQIEDMFQPVSEYLRHLNFVGFTSCVYLFNRHYSVKFPPMPALESLTVAMPWEMKKDMDFSYQRHVPSLKEVCVIHHDPEVFNIFLMGSCSVTLEKCTMICIQPHVFADSGYRSSSQRMDHTKVPIIEAIHLGFSNLTHLGIGVTSNFSMGLEYVLNKMILLKSLAIYVEANEKFNTWINFDSLFTGMSPEACASLVKSKDVEGYWDSIYLSNSRFPSIRKLSELEALYIIETTYPCCRAFSFGENGGSGHGSCDFDINTLPSRPRYGFTDVSFHFSFLRMTKLKKLAFTRGFMPSNATREKWVQEKGLKIRYLKAPKLYHLLTARFALDDDQWYLEA